MTLGREFAKVVLLSCVNQELLGQRVRVVARVIGTKPDSSFIWIEDNGSVALADVSAVLASDNSTVDLFCQPKCHIMVTGYVEELEPHEVAPSYSGITRPEATVPLVVRAILVQSVPNINIGMWRESVSAREKLIEQASLLGHPQNTSSE